MLSFRLAALGLAALLASAVAQEATSAPFLSAQTTLQAVDTGVQVRLTLQNSSSEEVTVSLTHNSKQACSVGPDVRVLAVGTREVVYPAPQGEPRICTQELRSQTVPAGGQSVLERTVPLPPGEYMVESWLQGFLGSEGGRAKLAAKPLRIKVK